MSSGRWKGALVLSTTTVRDIGMCWVAAAAGRGDDYHLQDNVANTSTGDTVIPGVPINDWIRLAADLSGCSLLQAACQL